MFIANTTLDILFKPEKPKLVSVLTKEEIKNKFEEIIIGFGVPVSSIKSKPAADTAVVNYNIDVPKDLPIPVLLTGVKSGFYDDGIELTSEEVYINGKTKVFIVDNGVKLLNVTLDIDNQLEREKYYVGFILDNFIDLRNAEINDIFNIPEKFSVILLPSENAQSIKRKVIQNNREYLIILNDEIDETAFKLRSGIDSKRIRRSIRNIIKNFDDAKLFIIDDNSELYGSEQREIIENEFQKRRMKLAKLSDFFLLEENGEVTYDNRFSQSLRKISSGGRAVFVIDADEFEEILPVIERYRKMGTKFVMPSAIKFGL